MSIATLNRKTKEKYHSASVGRKQFSLNGPHRNQGWVGQESLSRSTYINNFSNNSNIVKPSVLSSTAVLEKIVHPSILNSTVIVKDKKLVLPLNVVKNVQPSTQSDRMIACRKILLNKISKIPVPTTKTTTTSSSTTTTSTSTSVKIGGIKEKCFTTKKIGSISYSDHLFGLAKASCT